MILRLFNKIREVLFFLLFISVFIASVIAIAPLKQTFEYNPDEGINLMKSLLILKGFSMYRQVWNDQPPLATVILSYWLKFFGHSVYHARILILIFSALFLWAFYKTVKALCGSFCASVAVALLLLSTAYLRFSVSVMIGVPALTFAMFSIYFVTIYKKFKLRYSLPLSGIFMALSLQTKLFTAFLIPLIILEIAQSERAGLKNKAKKNKILFSVFLWIIPLLAAYFSIAMIFFRFNFILLIRQLFQTHISKYVFNKPHYGFSVILGMLSFDYDIVLLASVATILIVRHKNRDFLFPVLWLASVFFILINHRPIWSHHYLLISIPCSWLAAVCLCEFFRNNLFSKAGKKPIDTFLRWVSAGIVLLTILAIPFKFERTCKNLWGATTKEECSLVELISERKKNTLWIMADKPIFAFYADIPTPPELAVMSEKRMLTGNLTPDYLISVLDKYKPEQILLARFDNYDPKVISYIEKKYSLVHQAMLSNYAWCLPYVWLADHSRFYKLLFSRKGYFCRPIKTDASVYLRKDITKTE